MTRKKQQQLEEAPQDTEISEEGSRGDFVRNHMKAARFVAKSDQAGKYWEAVKTYQDPSGSLALVTALFLKDATQRDPETLEGFTITVSMHVRATEEDIDRRAWKFAKQELLTLSRIFGGPETQKRHVVTIDCARCKKTSADWVDVRDQKICYQCYERTLNI